MNKTKGHTVRFDHLFWRRCQEYFEVENPATSIRALAQDAFTGLVAEADKRNRIETRARAETKGDLKLGGKFDLEWNAKKCPHCQEYAEVGEEMQYLTVDGKTKIYHPECAEELYSIKKNEKSQDNWESENDDDDNEEEEEEEEERPRKRKLPQKKPRGRR
jgi:hypothetical protein